MKKFYTNCPEGGSAIGPDVAAGGGGCVLGEDEAAEVVDAPSGISTDFQSSPGSTVTAIRSPIFAFWPSGIYVI